MDRRKTDRRDNVYGDIYVLDIQSLLNIVYKRKFLAIALTLLVLVPGALYVMAKPQIYKATASVLLENQDINLTDFQAMIPQAKFDDLSLETQARTIASAKVIHLTLDELDRQKAEAAGQDTKAQKDQAPRSDVEIQSFFRNMTVLPQGRSRLIDISYQSENPVEAANVANTHAEQYIQYQIHSKKEQLDFINKWIAQQVESLKKEGQEKSTEVQAFRKDAGIVLGKDSEDLIYQQITDISGQLIPLETQKLNLQARLDALTEKKSPSALTEVVNSQLIQNLKSQASSGEQELKALDSAYGPNHPKMLAAKRKVQQANADIGREIANIRNSVRIELDAAQKQEDLLRSRLEELNKHANEMRSKEITLESLEAEETANRTMLENFLSRAEEIKSQLDFTRADVRLVSKAEIPAAPIGMRKSLMIALLAIFSVIFGLIAVLLLELIDRGLESPEDVRKIMNLKLIGTLPKAKNPLAEGYGKTRSKYIEEVRRIYLALSARKEPQSILITAARSGEGKTTTVMTLGKYLAAIKARAIVVDANMSSPSIATIAGVNPAPGFAEYIAGTADLSKVVYRDENGLAIIPSGNTAIGSDLLAGDAFTRLLTTLKMQYDFVLIDCAPVGETTDAEVIARQVDQTILIVEYAGTPKKKLKLVAEVLRQHSKDVPGVILNKWR